MRTTYMKKWSDNLNKLGMILKF